MLSNIEVKRWLASGLATTLIALLLSTRLPGAALLILLSLSWATSGLILLRRHYRRLNMLADDLQRAERVEYRLDWLEYREGEFSVLVTEIAKMTERLQQQAILLQREKDNLVELLTSLMMLSDFLSEENLSQEQRERFVLEMQSQLERLENLVNSLLDLAKLDAGLVLKKKKVSLERVAHRALQSLSIPLEMQQIEVELSLDPQAYFWGDESWTMEAIINLIKNALEHTPPGGRISIVAEQNSAVSRLAVTNTGEGIPVQEIPFLFDRFFRGNQAKANSVGIGLAIVRAIARGQGGDVEVASVPGRGATFAIKFYPPQDD